MNTKNLLVGALVAQIGLAAVTWMPTDGAPTEARALVEGGGNAVTAVEIAGSGADAKSVKLESKDGKWVVREIAQRIGELW